MRKIIKRIVEFIDNPYLWFSLTMYLGVLSLFIAIVFEFYLYIHPNEVCTHCVEHVCESYVIKDDEKGE